MEKQKLISLLKNILLFSAVAWAGAMIGLAFAVPSVAKSELLVIIPIAGFSLEFLLISTMISKIKEGKEVRFKDLL